MKRKPLSTLVSESLPGQIRSGALAPGAKLPTEAELCTAHGVSRTVVREAVARLRSEGLVIPRQGKGVFVSEAPLQRFTIPDHDLRALPQTLSLLELRLAVEVEAAGLCARRCGPAQAAAIRAEMARVDAAHPDPSESRVHYDHAFHLAIARGAGNPHVLDFLKYLQSVLVPRLRLGYVVSPDLKEDCFGHIHAEHEAIVTAIERRDAAGARAAMRRRPHGRAHQSRSLKSNAGDNDLDTHRGRDLRGLQHRAHAARLATGAPGVAPPPRLERGLTFDDAATMRRAAHQGLCIGLISRRAGAGHRCPEFRTGRPPARA